MVKDGEMKADRRLESAKQSQNFDREWETTQRQRKSLFKKKDT